MDFITPVCPLQKKFPLSCCLLAGLFKPTAYVQFDPYQLDGNAAMHVVGVPVCRVLVNYDEVRTEGGLCSTGFPGVAGWQLLNAAPLKLPLGGAVWQNADCECHYTASFYFLISVGLLLSPWVVIGN